MAEREEAIPPEEMLHPHPYTPTYGELRDGVWHKLVRSDFLCNLCRRSSGHPIHEGKRSEDSKLLEALAKQLYEAGCAADPTDDFKWNSHRALMGLARETLRQMEWSWGEGFDYCCKRGHERRSAFTPPAEPFGAAPPPDWTPE